MNIIIDDLIITETKDINFWKFWNFIYKSLINIIFLYIWIIKKMNPSI